MPAVLMRQAAALWQLVVLLAMVTALAGCSHIQLVAPYDASTDTELASLLQDTTTFVARMTGKAGTPEGSYAQNSDFYDQVDGRVAVLVARAQANRVMKNCPSTQVMKLVLDNAGLPPDVRASIGTPPQDDCDVTLMTLIQQQYTAMRAFHQAQGNLGIPAAASGPLLEGGVGSLLRAGMMVQRAKQGQGQ